MAAVTAAEAARAVAAEIERVRQECPGFNCGRVVVFYRENKPVGYIDADGTIREFRTRR